MIDDSSQNSLTQSRLPKLWLFAAIVLLVILSTVTTYLLHARQTAEAYVQIENRQQLIATSRSELIQAWIASLQTMTEPVVISGPFRLFVVEALTSGEARTVAAQEPYMAEVLAQLVRQNRMHASYVIGDGRVLLTSPEAADPGDRVFDLASQVIRSGSPATGPVRTADDGRLVIDVLRPLNALENRQGQAPTVAALVLTAPISPVIEQSFARRENDPQGEVTMLLQHRNVDQWRVATAAAADSLKPIGAVVEANFPDQVGLAARNSLLGGNPVLSVSVPIKDTPWSIVQEIDQEIALRDLRRTQWVTITIASLVTLALSGALVALWFSQANTRNRTMVNQYRLMASKIEARSRLLVNVTSAIEEWIGFKKSDGTYSYINRAFAAAVGRSADELVGMTDQDIFGAGVGERLTALDRIVFDRGNTGAVEMTATIGERLRHLIVSKVALSNEDNTQRGIITVMRDVTEQHEQRQRYESAMEGSIQALTRTLELTDPFIAGHSRLVAQIAVAVGTKMALPPEDIASLRIAGNLSDIGKAFIPKEILTKPGALTAQEIAVMRQHVTLSDKILEGIDFGLPVRGIVAQIRERLDGSGYPKGLQGEQIHPLSQVLAVCDVFAALIRPRSYRSAMPLDQALSILQQEQSKFSSTVTQALTDIVQTPSGKALVERVLESVKPLAEA
ncbi:MAG: HD domain-containing phosphohydrolase [Pseudomonadota bacterium]